MQGPWDGERMPYWTGVMNALMPEHPAPHVVLMKSSQVGGTSLALNWVGWMVCNASASLLALFPTTVDARDWTRTKLNRLIATTPALQKLISLRRTADGGNSLSQKTYPGGTMYIGSANIPTFVAGKSMPFLLLDEVDRFPPTLQREGDPVELAKARAFAFPSKKKCFEISSPTAEGSSRIARDYEKSTQDRYHVPCPHCGHMQHLRWEQLKWPDGHPDRAAYLCEAEGCGALIEEHHKTNMLARGEWRAKHPEREATCKGFHLNALYTPEGLGSKWSEHAAKWEESQNHPEEMQPFYNTRLGEVYRGESKRVDWEIVAARREPYKLRTIPPGVLILTSFTDVQKDRLETQIVGWGRDERATVIDYKVHYGDTTQRTTNAEGVASVWATLDTYLAESFVNSFRVSMQLQCSMIDSAYLGDTVLWFTRPRKGRRIFATRGSTSATRQPIGRPTFPDVKHRGKADNRWSGAERYELGVSALKHWLYEMLRADEGDPSRKKEEPDEPATIANRHIRFSIDLPDDYFRQLTAEKYDPKHGWIERAFWHRNEALDTMVGARAAAMHHSVNLHRMREADWQRLEELYQPAEGKKAAPIEPSLSGGRFLPVSATTGAAADLP